EVVGTMRTDELKALLAERIAVLDGAWGTMFQNAKLAPGDYRADWLADHTHDVAGDPDLLNLTRPDLVLDVHRRYLAAGADITTTNTFTPTSIGPADHRLPALGPQMNPRGARLAPQAAGEAGGRVGARPTRPRQEALSL